MTGTPAVPQEIVAQSRRLQRAIDTGNVSGLPRGERATIERLQQFAALAAALGAAAPANPTGPPRTIDDRLERAAECGTHSILDIERTGGRAGLPSRRRCQPLPSGVPSAATHARPGRGTLGGRR